MPVTPFQFSQMLARTQRNSGRVPTQGEPVKREADLREQVISFCEGQGWLVGSARTDRRSSYTTGWPDLTVIANEGKTFLVELKRTGGKPSVKQLGTLALARKLGHKAAICESMAEFFALIEGVP